MISTSNLASWGEILKYLLFSIYSFVLCASTLQVRIKEINFDLLSSDIYLILTKKLIVSKLNTLEKLIF
jgi:hypothetical protein